ncbi:phytoene/squalene synthase family protein [Compostimonas suwonensis]|uniref:Phytoene/squalene synthetase n=1 Tax=Compostimonas suwonensis TaxID=1048394 RepID=A0A2M9BZG9_9MICO|nr:squalene/phytoene synthase family protein [Compostimonas suwonensis]PJJ63481.1 phytoene/squalene synthetase [Compostimonas suwonensis]
MSARAAGPLADIGLYNRAAQASSSMIIGQYSTSFGLAARLLDSRTRGRVRTIYALVRIADEIVDGAAEGAGVDAATQRRLLDTLEEETLHAMSCGYSTNLVVHAFAVTARETGIGASLTAPFFAAMRRDLDHAPFTPASIAEYIHGSAEVVGLMCLRAFLCDSSTRSAHDAAVLEEGAERLGAAFQKVNFLRDLAADTLDLGRNYFPGLDPAHLSEADKRGILDDIDADLDAAARALPLLPRGCRAAVTAAYALFARLSSRLRTTPAQELLAQRVRVPAVQKLGLVVGAALGGGVRAR